MTKENDKAQFYTFKTVRGIFDFSGFDRFGSTLDTFLQGVNWSSFFDGFFENYRKFEFFNNLNSFFQKTIEGFYNLKFEKLSNFEILKNYRE